MASNGVLSQLSCNRHPFQADSGCQRGSVDIHQFDDLPFCETIDPTPADIPPEIVDTPLQIPVPPACACVNINHALEFKYSKNRKFITATSFRANGDCCDGNYLAKFDIQVPCPIVPKEKYKKLKARFKIGNRGTAVSASLSYIRLDRNSCTINPKDINLNIELPCPVHGLAYPKKIKMKIGYGDNQASKSEQYIKANADSCTIEAQDVNFDLKIPCPVKNIKTSKKISAKVRYGNDNSTTQHYINANQNDCTINAEDVNLQMQIHCPIKSATGGKIKASIKYGRSFNTVDSAFIKANNNSCTIEALSPNLNLEIPCPIQPDPNYRNPKIKVGIRYGSSRQSTSASFIETDSINCTIRGKDANLNLNLPCPINSITKKPKLKVGISYGSGKKSDSVSFIEQDKTNCTIKGKDATIRLNIPCPVGSNLNPKIRVGIAYGGGNTAASGEFIVQDPANCTMYGKDANLSLNLPCPVSKSNLKFSASYTTGSGNGSFKIAQDTSNGCARTIKFHIKFPKGGGGGSCQENSVQRRVIIDQEYASHTLKAKYATWVTKCGEIIRVTEDNNWTTIFTAVAHTGSCS